MDLSFAWDLMSFVKLHFANPNAYQDIYNLKNRWDKEASLYKSFLTDHNTFCFLSYKESKEGRDLLYRSFSPLAIYQCEGILMEKVEKLCVGFSSYPIGQTVDLAYAFQSFALDMITYLSFGNSFNALDHPQFCEPILVALDRARIPLTTFKYSPLLVKVARSMPPVLSAFINPSMEPLGDLQFALQNQIKDLIRDPKHGLEHLPHDKTIYHRLLDPNRSCDGDATPSGTNLMEEAVMLVSAGAGTVSNALVVGFFHLLQHSASLGQVKQELDQHWPDTEAGTSPSLKRLEKLPYVNAVIKESLRPSNGVVTCMPRVVPESGATITGVYVPPKNIVSCGNTFVHQNPEIFQHPTEFRPERWLNPQRPDLDNWLVAFSKGPRMCLGMNLAWAELRLVFAHVLRKFEMALVESSPEELKYRDTFIPHWDQHVFAHVNATEE